jgi:hypothetical protein
VRVPPSPRNLVSAAAAAVFCVALAPFLWSTTFFTDDHLLLAFARYTPNPLAAFGHDLHGGEFYRPLSMSLWWLLARLGGGGFAPFAVVGATLHLLVAVQIAWWWRALGGERAAAWSAAAFFWLSPETREAALWAAAFPDLLGTALVLGSLLALLRERRTTAIALGACAFLTKESAIVLPALAALVLIVRARGVRRGEGSTGGERGPSPSGPVQSQVALTPVRRGEGRSEGSGKPPSHDFSATLRAHPRDLAVLAVLGLLAAAYLLARWRVLGGWGGTGDPRAPLVGRLLQILSGLVHVVTGADIFPEPLAWGAGVAVLAVAVLAAWRARGRVGSARALLAPLAFTAIAVLPLLAAGWIIGARYFYLPAVGLAWLVGQAVGEASAAWRAGGLLLMLLLGSIQTLSRHADVAAYDRRVTAARRAVIDGLAHGHRVFHIAGGVKDLDLAVKESPALRAAEDQVLILGDVPASFVAIPPDLEPAAAFLIAQPPLPPSGAYHFGPRRVVGLARRGDEPTLEELVARFPDVRFIRLRAAGGDRVVARDVTPTINEE